VGRIERYHRAPQGEIRRCTTRLTDSTVPHTTRGCKFRLSDVTQMKVGCPGRQRRTRRRRIQAVNKRRASVKQLMHREDTHTHTHTHTRVQLESQSAPQTQAICLDATTGGLSIVSPYRSFSFSFGGSGCSAVGIVLLLLSPIPERGRNKNKQINKRKNKQINKRKKANKQEKEQANKQEKKQANKQESGAKVGFCSMES
jgi:hypothetical protein